MPQATYVVNLAVGGVAISKVLLRSGNHANSFEIGPTDLPPGKDVTSWVKTDANTAGCNLPSGHGYSNGNFDVYWDGGIRYGVPGTISTNALTLDGGAGDDFPASATTGIVVCRQVQINTPIDGDAIQIIGLCAQFADEGSEARCHIDFQDGAASSIAALELLANQPQIYDVAGGATNPFTGDLITVAYASNGSATDTATLLIPNLEDSTP